MNKPTKFIRALEQASNGEEPQADWGQIRTDWIAEVGRLVKRIAEFVELAGEKISCEPRSFHRVEEGIGPYDIDGLAIEGANREIVVEPIARLIIGGEGRVDIKAGGRRAMLVHIDGVWYLMNRNLRGVGTKKLTDEILDETLAGMLS